MISDQTALITRQHFCFESLEFEVAAFQHMDSILQSVDLIHQELIYLLLECALLLNYQLIDEIAQPVAGSIQVIVLVKLKVLVVC